MPDLSMGEPPFAHRALDVALRRRHNGCDHRHVKRLSASTGLLLRGRPVLVADRESGCGDDPGETEP
jgi:hypothetical protein